MMMMMVVMVMMMMMMMMMMIIIIIWNVWSTFGYSKYFTTSLNGSVELLKCFPGEYHNNTLINVNIHSKHK